LFNLGILIKTIPLKPSSNWKNSQSIRPLLFRAWWKTQFSRTISQKSSKVIIRTWNR